MIPAHFGINWPNFALCFWHPWARVGDRLSQPPLDRAHKLGLEGLIGKRAGSRYEAGKRTGAWIKVKLHQEQEFVIGGYTEPEGSRKYFGATVYNAQKVKRLHFANLHVGSSLRMSGDRTARYQRTLSSR